jgi:adenylate cyclase
MVTEIGRYKREIAYHGDTINTASRIQGKCNELGADLLLSKDLTTKINMENYLIKKVDSIRLRGKKNEIIIYKVNIKGQTYTC